MRQARILATSSASSAFVFSDFFAVSSAQVTRLLLDPIPARRTTLHIRIIVVRFRTVIPVRRLRCRLRGRLRLFNINWRRSLDDHRRISWIRVRIRRPPEPRIPTRRDDDANTVAHTSVPVICPCSRDVENSHDRQQQQGGAAGAQSTKIHFLTPVQACSDKRLCRKNATRGNSVDACVQTAGVEFPCASVYINRSPSTENVPA